MISDEEAKAAQEVTKAGRQLGEFIGRFVEGPLQELSLALEDSLRVWRHGRALRLADKVEEQLRERGLDGPTQKVPMKVLLPIVEAASIEDDDDLQDLWANLLTNAADRTSEVEVTVGLIGVLREFGHLEAQLLKLIYESPPLARHGEVVFAIGIPDDLAKQTKASKRSQDEVDVALWHLRRLGCVDAGEYNSEPATLKSVKITPLGKALIEAATDKK